MNTIKTEMAGHQDVSDRHRSRRTRSQSGPRKAGRTLLMLFRRVHLYSGLFMFPWVLLYGFTGWFFNHPGILTGDQVVHYQASDVLDGSLTSLPSAETTAAAVVEAINARSGVSGGPEVKLLGTRRPQFRDIVRFDVKAKKATHQVRLNPSTGNGEIRTSYVAPPSRSTATRNPLAGIPNERIKSTALSEAASKLPALLAELGLESGDQVKRIGQARINFLVEADGVPCVVTYNLASGSIASVVDHQRAPITPKRLMERMHLTRSYAPGLTTRWFWALIVDSMFVSMVFWALSGILMWWQVKRTRRLGLAVLVLSAATTTMMTYAMHETLTTRDVPAKTQSPTPPKS